VCKLGGQINCTRMILAVPHLFGDMGSVSAPPV
jgi:hypothetical protein